MCEEDEYVCWVCLEYLHIIGGVVNLSEALRSMLMLLNRIYVDFICLTVWWIAQMHTRLRELYCKEEDLLNMNGFNTFLYALY